MLGLQLDSTELIVFWREVVCQITQKIEIRRAVAVVGRDRRRGGRVVNLMITVVVSKAVVTVVVTVGLAGAVGRGDYSGGSRGNGSRGGRHSGRRERIGR